ncbi:transcriptional regulator [Pseudomonas aeruginosa]|uniref:helix-turn-helix domain-containing protein n=1 Tax=Pseudomonas aeruginosa TaxID=287 RepID=UPI001068216C|nr:transcriptional regulator [Pseudomonas aeruginosa]EKB9378521.1 transcriptional regulator [Pseudomonas aeruginosa]EKU3642643.1 transcriptional regulator [Pseudomonas aeruginosa]ELF1006727.1 transcriptional regulator [Pseudomonas aeruginosa]ELK4737816.1 transcriptional regulator [Pseudomonas aeruginosa]MBG4771291.1 transcriptional regulator [Pseudomonas aeruginosa]
MSALLKQATEHWRYVAPLLTPPETEADYDALVEALDELLDEIGGQEHHPLAALASQMGDLIATYDALHYPLPEAPGHEVLRFLMTEHQLTQSDLPEIGAQSVVSEILGGRRQLNVRHIRALTQRFNVPADIFL